MEVYFSLNSTSKRRKSDESASQVFYDIIEAYFRITVHQRLMNLQFVYEVTYDKFISVLDDI